MSPRIALAALIAAVLLLLAGAGPANAATPIPSAVVLVSGFDTETPFTTPDPACAGKEGPAWSPAGGVAGALKAAGMAVFTAPVRQNGKPVPTPCAPGTDTPPDQDAIDSNGDLNANGTALASFLSFLHEHYGVQNVALIGHSDGGLWSRAAISQPLTFPDVTVTSLTTLGTPHTGSFMADLAEDLHGGRCHASNHVTQLVCDALLVALDIVVADLGPTTTEELTSDYLTTWNPEQTIGDCRVTGIAGTRIDLPLPHSLLPAYANPSDGLVGEASALARASRSLTGTPIPAPGIPGFVAGPTFPVVHGDSFKFLDAKNLLNQPAISQAVLTILQGVPAGGPACASGVGAELAGVPRPRTDGAADSTAPLFAVAVPAAGRLPTPRRSDAVLTDGRARVTCAGRPLASAPLFGRSTLRVWLPHGCTIGMRARGGKVLLIRRPGGTVGVRIRGTAIQVRVHGVRVRRLVTAYDTGGSVRPLRLSASGRGTLPEGSGSLSVHAVVTTRDGSRLTASTTVSR